MKNPKVTIGIPFYNNSGTLKTAINSILMQTYTDWELILINDGSQDNSCDIAKQYLSDKVTLINDDKNIGLAARLNQITSLAKGQYIARMDADDMCGPERISLQVKYMEENLDVDFVGTGICYLNNNDIPIGELLLPSNHSDICKKPFNGISICHASILVRKEWYQKNQYSNITKVAQDQELWLKTYSKSKYANLTQPLYYYRLCSSFTLKKSIKARIVLMRTIATTISFNVSKTIKCFYIIIQFLKMITTIFMYLFGMRDVIIKKRYNAIADKDYNEIFDNINKIKNCIIK